MNKQGFTLLELLAVIAVVALLAAGLVPNLLQARKTAHSQATRGFMREVITGIETRRELATNTLPDASTTCAELAGKPLPYSVRRCKYEPDSASGYTVTAESISGQVFQFDGANTRTVPSF